QRDEIERRDDAPGRMVPADQRLEADEALVGGIDQRLIVEPELLEDQGLAKILFEPEPVLRLILHVGAEIAAFAAPLRLGLIEGEVGLLDEVVDALAVDRAEGAADRHADADLDLVDDIGLRDRLDQPAGEILDLLAALAVADDDREFVAAHASDMADVADFPDQPLGDALQHRVALGMAEGVVDRLEAVE